ncbi:hypothetical protein C7T35_28555 [Variovorax sp. WS11]|uniref:hypothetical protein n=1 Tax=Variovorax sp. WS11 TaxID=1105204 RepID=UPI000D0D8E04|nr:hypothetical protein [Variovorax sp. WS11]NDZ13558.1 hypothetical protein [Variovorax sp. WS11]PSL81128.1 hypothetical protein C7T35_28555 [Variovorax sp. WS11]
MDKPCGMAVLCAGAAAAAMMVISPAWAHEPGRMTGGGSFFCPYYGGTQKVTHGFELHCGTGGAFEGADPAEPNNLEINFSGGDNFHLTTLRKGLCSNDPAIDQTPPNSSLFDTFVGEGTGTFNGQPAAINFTFVDAGEPGTLDTARVLITVGASTVLDCDDAAAPLTFGNHQAHKLTGNK